MSEMGKVLSELGVLPAETVRELQRWHTPATEGIDPDKTEETETGLVASPQTVTNKIEEVLQGRGLVEVKETDLSLLVRYRETARPRTLHLEDDTGSAADIAVSVGTTLLGESVFPWTSEGIADVMMNGMSYLLEDEKKIFFNNVREVYLGDDKYFMVCSPVKERP